MTKSYNSRRLNLQVTPVCFLTQLSHVKSDFQNPLLITRLNQ